MGPPGWATIEAGIADELVQSSRLLSQIADDEPSIAVGPISPAQHWIPTNRGAEATTAANAPAITRFIDPAIRPDPRASAHHLRGGGLYTSSVSRTGKGMWELFLEIYPSALTPKPWIVWELLARPRAIVEISSASDWRAFVEAYPRKQKKLLYPDWSSVSVDFEGVHVTARAIAAAQGFSFITSRGLTAPGFWDVEQTIWLKWAFESSRLLRTHE
jgi:hypothetical protein